MSHPDTNSPHILNLISEIGFAAHNKKDDALERCIGKVISIISSNSNGISHANLAPQLIALTAKSAATLAHNSHPQQAANGLTSLNDAIKEHPHLLVSAAKPMCEAALIIGAKSLDCCLYTTAHSMATIASSYLGTDDPMADKVRKLAKDAVSHALSHATQALDKMSQPKKPKAVTRRLDPG